MATIAVLGTFDTKGEELAFVAELLILQRSSLHPVIAGPILLVEDMIT